MAFGVSRAIAAMQEDRHPVAKLQQEVEVLFTLMTQEALQRAERLGDNIQRVMQRHATSQLAKNTLKNMSSGENGEPKDRDVAEALEGLDVFPA